MSRGSLVYADLRHDCETPDMEHLPRYGDDGQVMARWRCPECGQRWQYAAAFRHYGRMFWSRVGGTPRRWRKAEAARLADVFTEEDYIAGAADAADAIRAALLDAAETTGETPSQACEVARGGDCGGAVDRTPTMGGSNDRA